MSEVKVRPMKAVSTTVEELPIPCYVGTKYDGIRAIIRDAVVLSLTLKPIPNRNIQEAFGKPEYNDLDMELTVGDIYSPDCFRNTTSIVMSHDKPIEGLQAHVFDIFTNPDEDYETRKLHVSLKLAAFPHDLMVDATAKLVESREQLVALMEEQRVLGGEGLIARKVDSKYKFGRSTLKEGFLYKMKFYEQAEFQVTNFTEQMHNANEAVVNELGRTSRSLAKDGLVPKNTLGALVLTMPDGRTFNCGTGFSDELRKEIWDNRHKYLYQQVSVRYMATGIKDLPRHPVFISFRHADDINNEY